VRIWDTTQAEHILKIEVKALGKEVRDLAWDSESKRIIAVGNGNESCVPRPSSPTTPQRDTRTHTQSIPWGGVPFSASRLFVHTRARCAFPGVGSFGYPRLGVWLGPSVVSHAHVSAARFGRAFMFDSGSSVGEIGGHSKTVNSVDIKPSRPFRAITVSDDLAYAHTHAHTLMRTRAH
jgi:hypothetical protein